MAAGSDTKASNSPPSPPPAALSHLCVHVMRTGQVGHRAVCSPRLMGGGGTDSPGGGTSGRRGHQTELTRIPRGHNVCVCGGARENTQVVCREWRGGRPAGVLMNPHQHEAGTHTPHPRPPPAPRCRKGRRAGRGSGAHKRTGSQQATATATATATASRRAAPCCPHRATRTHGTCWGVMMPLAARNGDPVGVQ
jgi:hypothetical protein